jgi:hypothetical protein
MNCWASVLGGCSTSHSQEHVVSASVFIDEVLNVENVAWVRGKRKQIPRRVLTAGVLCKTHNEALSSLDAEAGLLAGALRSLAVGKAPRTYQVDGIKFERWLLKTMINLGTSGWRPDGSMTQPPRDLVEIVHGLKTFFGISGLYVPNNYSIKKTDMDQFQWRIILSNSIPPQALGVVTLLRKFPAILVIPANGTIATLEGLLRTLGSSDILNFTNIVIHHRPRNVECKDGPHTMQLRFKWT